MIKMAHKTENDVTGLAKKVSLVNKENEIVETEAKNKERIEEALGEQLTPIEVPFGNTIPLEDTSITFENITVYKIGERDEYLIIDGCDILTFTQADLDRASNKIIHFKRSAMRDLENAVYEAAKSTEVYEKTEPDEDETYIV